MTERRPATFAKADSDIARSDFATVRKAILADLPEHKRCRSRRELRSCPWRMDPMKSRCAAKRSRCAETAAARHRNLVAHRGSALVAAWLATRAPQTRRNCVATLKMTDFQSPVAMRREGRS